LKTNIRTLGKKILDQTIEGEEDMNLVGQSNGLLLLRLTRTDGAIFLEKIIKKD
jgi:hypothetical protein